MQSKDARPPWAAPPRSGPPRDARAAPPHGGRQGQPVSPPSSGVTFTAVGSLLMMFVATAVGVVVDVLTGPGISIATTITLTVGTLLAALLVQRRELLTVVIAPPLILAVASVLALSLLPDLIFSLASVGVWLVYGFPAMALATLVALLVAGLRMINGR